MLEVTRMWYPDVEKVNGKPTRVIRHSDKLWTAKYGDGPEFTTDCPLRAVADVLEMALSAMEEKR